MDRVLKILPDIITLIVSGGVVFIITECFCRLTRLKRFGSFYTILSGLLLIIMPVIVHDISFAYFGSLSGMGYMMSFMASIVGMVFYTGTSCWNVLTGTAAKRRFVYCITAFYIVGIAFLFYMSSTANGPIIG